MTAMKLLEDLKAFQLDAVKDLMLKTAPNEQNPSTRRAAEVYTGRLPDSKSAKKKCPYILNQYVTGRDTEDQSVVTIRSVFAVYDDDEQDGSCSLLTMMERVRVALRRQVVIGEQFELDLKTGLEPMAYPEDTAPFFIGEMSTTWKLPVVRREVTTWP